MMSGYVPTEEFQTLRFKHLNKTHSKTNQKYITSSHNYSMEKVK